MYVSQRAVFARVVVGMNKLSQPNDLFCAFARRVEQVLFRNGLSPGKTSNETKPRVPDDPPTYGEGGGIEGSQEPHVNRGLQLARALSHLQGGHRKERARAGGGG